MISWVHMWTEPHIWINACIHWRFWCCFISLLQWALIMLSAVYSPDRCKKTHSIVIDWSGFSPSGLASHVHMKVKSLSDLTALTVTQAVNTRAVIWWCFFSTVQHWHSRFPQGTVRDGFINASSACTGCLYIAHTPNTMAIQSTVLAKFEEK